MVVIPARASEEHDKPSVPFVMNWSVPPNILTTIFFDAWGWKRPRAFTPPGFTTRWYVGYC